MSKYFLYSVTTGQVLQWQDTELWNYAEAPEGTAIETPTEEEWDNRQMLKWFLDGTLTRTAQAPAAPKSTKDEAVAIAMKKCEELLKQAAKAIAPLQDAVDLNDATTTEKSNLIAWKRYRIAVNRVQDQSGYPLQIDWPATPSNETSPELQD